MDDSTMDPPETPSIQTVSTQHVSSSTITNNNTEPSQPLAINTNLNTFHSNMLQNDKSARVQIKTPFNPRPSQVPTPSNDVLYSQPMFKPKDIQTSSSSSFHSLQHIQKSSSTQKINLQKHFNQKSTLQMQSNTFHRTPFQPSAPRQIPYVTQNQQKQLQTSFDAPPPTANNSNLASSLPISIGLHINSPNSLAIPQSLPNVQPSYPATLFGGLSADDEHVTVWEPSTGKTVAGNAAPYRRNLKNWLKAHSGWEEKADELKSSKRRSAARRAKSAADSFAALCCYPVATYLLHDASQRLQILGCSQQIIDKAMKSWGMDDFIRLQEALYRLGQECHKSGTDFTDGSENRWAAVQKHVGSQKMEGIVVYFAHLMLRRGITKSQKDLTKTNLPQSFGAIAGSLDSFAVGSPASFGSFDVNPVSSLENVGPKSLGAIDKEPGAVFLEKTFRAPREPRVTVWNPITGKTISGNAAPCRRNLNAWMKQHPGWVPKEEGQLSSSRRNRNRKIRSSPSRNSSVAGSVEPESPHFHDAIQGLLGLWRSPTAYSPSQVDNDCEMVDDMDVAGSASPAHVTEIENNVNSSATEKKVVISSVSSSSGGEADADFSGSDERDADDPEDDVDENDKMDI